MQMSTHTGEQHEGGKERERERERERVTGTVSGTAG